MIRQFSHNVEPWHPIRLYRYDNFPQLTEYGYLFGFYFIALINGCKNNEIF